MGKQYIMLGRASKTELRARKKKQDVSDTSSWFDEDDENQQPEVDVASTDTTTVHRSESDKTVAVGMVGVDGVFSRGSGWDGGEDDTSLPDTVEMHGDDDGGAMLHTTADSYGDLQQSGAFVDAGAV